LLQKLEDIGDINYKAFIEEVDAFCGRLHISLEKSVFWKVSLV
jgi:hypothetical protein